MFEAKINEIQNTYGIITMVRSSSSSSPVSSIPAGHRPPS